MQQMAEELIPHKQVPINASVAKAAGLDVHKSRPAIFTPNKHFFRTTPIPSNNKRKPFIADSDPIVTPGMSASEIKRRMGFPNEQHMLAYIIFVCDGDINEIRKRYTLMTWYEEWFFHLERKWGRTLLWWVDATSEIGVQQNKLKKIVDHKLSLEKDTRRRWPMFASYEEDQQLRKDKWNAKHDSFRPVMWDMMGLSAYNFSNAQLQRITYSKYYAKNCFKGGIFTQFCGWLGTYDLWTGAVSDTEYNKNAGYLNKQASFQKEDLVDRKVIPFLNIYDKGYRAKMVAWRSDRQLVLQPLFRKSDQRFNQSETIRSASVASDRGGNERAVNVSKRSSLVSQGYLTGMCPK